MTEIEIFEEVQDHLLRQNARATDAYGTCAYRGEKDRKCAIGCLISDALYDREIEGISVGNVDKENHYAITKLREILAASVGELTEGKLNLLRALQMVHDKVDPYQWQPALAAMRILVR